MTTLTRVTCRRVGAVAACEGLPKRRAHHSPTGYEWGYGGSGPADLALNILAAVLPRRDPDDRDRVRLDDRSWVSERVWNLHQHFKWELIARLPREGFTLSRQDVHAWINASHAGERAALCQQIIAREAKRAQTDTTTGTRHRMGRGGHIAGYSVIITPDTIHAFHEPSDRHWTHPVPNVGTGIHDLSQRPGFRLGWARMEDDAEILYFYDRNDGNFGYALNVTDPHLSEWGYAPFR